MAFVPLIAYDWFAHVRATVGWSVWPCGRPTLTSMASVTYMPGLAIVWLYALAVRRTACGVATLGVQFALQVGSPDAWYCTPLAVSVTLFIHSPPFSSAIERVLAVALRTIVLLGVEKRIMAYTTVALFAALQLLQLPLVSHARAR